MPWVGRTEMPIWMIALLGLAISLAIAVVLSIVDDGESKDDE